MSAKVCLTVKQCQLKFHSLNLGGTFYSGSDFHTKGCYTKNKNVYFGIGGTYVDKAETNLSGDLARVFCDAEEMDASDIPTLSTAAVGEEPTTAPIANDAVKSTPTTNKLATTVCITVKQCLTKWQSLNNGGDFASDTFPSKGCFTKNNNVFFGMGGTYEEKAAENLPGNLTRVWCDGEKEAQAFTVFIKEDATAAEIPTTSPTSKPTTKKTKVIRTMLPTSASTTKPVAGFIDIVPLADVPTSAPTSVAGIMKPIVALSAVPTWESISTKPPTVIRTKRPSPATILGPNSNLLSPTPSAGRSKKPSSAPSTSTQPTTSLHPTGMVWNHGSTTTMSNGEGFIKFTAPSAAEIGDTLFLFFSRTDGPIPLRIKGWTNAAQCFKSSNEQEACMDESTCRFTIKKESIEYCKEFAKGRGKDLGQAVFYHTLTQADKDGSADGWRFWSMNLHGTNKAWAIVVAIPNVNENHPVRNYAGLTCDKEHGSVFASVFGKTNDVLLLSQGFDDSAKKAHFLPPPGTSLLSFITGDDEAGFVYGNRIVGVGETGKLTTGGSGGRRNDAPGVGATKRLKHHRDCKDVTFSVMVNRSK